MPAVLLLFSTGTAPLLLTFVTVYAVCQLAVVRYGRTGETARREGIARREWRRILLRFVLLGGLLTASVAVLAPAELFNFPKRAPFVWLLVILLYPFLSAYPQEVIYRAFMFRRYAPLIATNGRMLLATALAFGWLHVLLESWVAVTLTVVGGWLFGDTYRRTRSLAAVSVEHALYGALVFTIGLGREFYLGAVRG